MPTSNASHASPLRAVREKAGLSQVALARAAGVSLSTVSIAERGGFLTERVAVAFAKVLGCKAKDIRPE